MATASTGTSLLEGKKRLTSGGGVHYTCCEVGPRWYPRAVASRLRNLDRDGPAAGLPKVRALDVSRRSWQRDAAGCEENAMVNKTPIATTGRSASRRLALGWALIVLGILPVLFPTTYLRISPLAIPAVEVQRFWAGSTSCEVCGAPANKRALKRYEAHMDRSGSYVGYNPREWPGNSEILFCAQHDGYPDLCVAYRLGRGALAYLLVFGANWGLRALFGAHGALLVFGIGVLVRLRRGKGAAQSAGPPSRATGRLSG